MSIFDNDFSLMMKLQAEGDVQSLIEQLHHKNPEFRGWAANALGKIRDARAVEPLTTCLDDEDKDVCYSAVWALGEIGDTRAVEALIAYLNDPENEHRYWVACTLGDIGDERAVEPMIDYLNGEQAQSLQGLQSNVAKGLSNIGKQAVLPLIASLRDGSASARKYVAEALGLIGDARAVESLIIYLSDEDDDVGFEAARTLSKIGEPAVLPLLDCLNHADANTRTNAIIALGNIGDARAAEPLLDYLNHEDSNTRANAAVALGTIGGTQAVKALLNSINDEVELVHRCAVTALGRIGDARAVKSLIAYLQNEAAEDDPLGRQSAVYALGEIGDPRAVPVLVRHLTDSGKTHYFGGSSVGVLAAKVLRSIGTPLAIAALKTWVENQDNFDPEAFLAAWEHDHD